MPGPKANKEWLQPRGTYSPRPGTPNPPLPKPKVTAKSIVSGDSKTKAYNITYTR